MAFETSAALIVAAGLVAGGLLSGGAYTVATGSTGSPTGGTVYVVNRFTGDTRVCTAGFCRPLRETPSIVPPE